MGADRVYHIFMPCCNREMCPVCKWNIECFLLAWVVLTLREGVIYES